jgi:hypothetical protein
VSNLSNLEKRKFEKLLGMSSGYVLDFSNRTFAEFVTDTTGLNIYDARYDYGSGSKANRLRKFWQIEENGVVAKLMGDMLDNVFPVGVRKSASDAALEAECRQIVGRLSQDGHPGKTSDNPRPQHEEQTSQQQVSQVLAQLKEEFCQLTAARDRNKAGLALEGLLNRLFALFGLQPRQPFRIVGEQIDGSFVLDGHVYLLESKWVKDPLPEADLLVFRGKIEAKSTFTRGVLIALNDVSTQARYAITQGKAPSFFVMNGHDLMMILSEATSLPEFLRKRVRLLAEEGRMCAPFSELV